MKNYYHLRVSFDKSQFLPWFVFVGSKNHMEIFVNIFCLEFNLHVSAKDWFVKGQEVHSGKIYEVWSRNPKYKDDEMEIILLPREKRK